MKTPKPKPRMSQPKRAARRRRMAAAADRGEPLASIVKREGLDPGYIQTICRGYGTISPYRAMTVRRALKIVRRRQLGMNYRQIANELKTTLGYVSQVVRIAEREGVLT